MTDLVTAVAATVDYDDWTTTANGEPVPQSTSETTIHTMSRLLHIRPGMTVMEIGTGSGYSGALLSGIVGPDGFVVSIDVDPHLVERARGRHQRAGHTNIELHAADGFNGWRASAPYDRVVAWVTPHLVPTAWVEQAKPDAMIVTPVKIADVAGANAVIRGVAQDGSFRNGTLHPGGFIEMAPEIITELGLPIRYVNAVRRPPGSQPRWISAHCLHDQPPHMAERLLDQLADTKPERGFLDRPAEDWRAFIAFALASTTSPASVGGEHGLGIGTASPGSVAVSLGDGSLFTAGTNEAPDELNRILDQWRQLGRPGFASLVPSATLGEDGWTIAPQLRP